MIPKTKPEDLSGALRIIAEWFDSQAAQSNEDADFWGHTIRARALDEAADYIDELTKRVSTLKWSHESIKEFLEKYEK